MMIAEEPPPPLLGNLLRLPAEALNARILAALATAGYGDLRPAHPTVFQHLPPDGARTTELAESAQMTKQSMGELIKFLVEAGYLERAPDPTDRRAQIIRLAPRGREVERIARATIAAAEAEWAAALGTERMANFQAFLRDLAEYLAAEASATTTRQ